MSDTRTWSQRAMAVIPSGWTVVFDTMIMRDGKDIVSWSEIGGAWSDKDGERYADISMTSNRIPAFLKAVVCFFEGNAKPADDNTANLLGMVHGLTARIEAMETKLWAQTNIIQELSSRAYTNGGQQ